MLHAVFRAGMLTTIYFEMHHCKDGLMGGATGDTAGTLKCDR